MKFAKPKLRKEEIKRNATNETESDSAARSEGVEEGSPQEAVVEEEESAKEKEGTEVSGLGEKSDKESPAMEKTDESEGLPASDEKTHDTSELWALLNMCFRFGFRQLRWIHIFLCLTFFVRPNWGIRCARILWCVLWKFRECATLGCSFIRQARKKERWHEPHEWEREEVFFGRYRICQSKKTQWMLSWLELYALRTAELAEQNGEIKV